MELLWRSLLVLLLSHHMAEGQSSTISSEITESETDITPGSLETNTNPGVTITEDTTAIDATITEDSTTTDVTITADTSTTDAAITEDTSTTDATITEDTSTTDAAITEDTSTTDATITEDTSTTDAAITEDTSTTDATITADTYTTDAAITEDTSTTDATITEDTSTTDAPIIEDTSTTDVPITADTTTTDAPITEDTSTTDVPITADTTTTDAPITEDTTVTDSPITEDTTTTDAPITEDTSTTDVPITADTTTTDAPIREDTSTTDAPITEDTSTPTVTTTEKASPPGVTTSSDTSSPDVTTPRATSPAIITDGKYTSTKTITYSASSPSALSTSVALSSQTTASSVTTSSSKPVGDCENGGHFDGVTCVCKPNFYGRKCEYVKSEIRPEISTKVDVTVRVENLQYNPELNDTNSQQYKEFDKRFQDEMRKVYEKLPNYQQVEIISIRSGSIIVQHRVVLLTFVEDYNRTLDVMETILNTTNCTDSTAEKLCFSPNTAQVVPAELNIQDACVNDATIPAEVRKYYFLKLIPGSVLCVSNCSDKNDYSTDCNNGQCSVTRQGPLCFCTSSDQFWYTGNHCQMSINKLGVYAGVPIATAALIITIVTLSIFLQRRRGGPYKERLIDAEQRWYEDGFEMDNKIAGSNWNPGATNNAAGLSKLSPPQDNFHPVLSNVDTSLKVKVPRPDVVSHNR